MSSLRASCPALPLGACPSFWGQGRGKRAHCNMDCFQSCLLMSCVFSMPLSLVVDDEDATVNKIA